jgi:hypothetical protein
MKLVEAEYVGLEDKIWTKVRVKAEIGGETKEGHLLFENDGRDIDAEGDLEELLQDNTLWEELWGDNENLKILEDEIKKGSEEYEAG